MLCLSIVTVQKHASEHQEHPWAATEILENMYVDDLLSGSDDDGSALEMIYELTNSMHIAGFHLRKWASNSKAVMKSIPDDEVAPEVVAQEVITRKKCLIYLKRWESPGTYQRMFSFSRLGLLYFRKTWSQILWSKHAPYLTLSEKHECMKGHILHQTNSLTNGSL